MIDKLISLINYLFPFFKVKEQAELILKLQDRIKYLESKILAIKKRDKRIFQEVSEDLIEMEAKFMQSEEARVSLIETIKNLNKELVSIKTENATSEISDDVQEEIQEELKNNSSSFDDLLSLMEDDDDKKGSGKVKLKI